ncbi:MAG: SdrD B-like domain-containing protein, partial [Pseudomonadota bacterium]
KEFEPPVAPPNTPVTLRLLLRNDNDQDATLNADLVDLLPTTPGAMIVATPANVATSCVGGTGIVTASPGAASVSVASGSVIQSGGCEVTVNVTASTAGDYLNAIPVGALQTDLGVNEAPTSATLSVSTLGYISGRVFLDNGTTPSGVFLPGSSDPIGGNTLELRSGSDCSGTVLATTVTDAQGNYLFTGLAAGTYSVCQPTQPSGTLNSISTEGTIVPVTGSTNSVGTAANPTPVTSQITGIVLGNDGSASVVSGSPGNNFSEVLPASISGNVYFDVDNDGLFDSGESGIGGVTIEITDGGSNTFSTTTNPDGSWSFEDLPPGVYTVTQTQPLGWTDGMDSAGTVGGTTTGSAAISDVISSITLGPGDTGIDYNFGEVISGGTTTITASAGASCSNNAAFINYMVDGFAPGSEPPVTLTFETVDGRVVAQFSNQPGAGSALWPGTVLDGEGNPSEWPGWAFIDGVYQEVDDDRVPEIVLIITVGGNEIPITLAYPPSTTDCAAQPPGTFAPEQIPTTPRWLLLLMAMGLIVLVRERQTARFRPG